MSDRTVDKECPSCGASAADRQNNKPDVAYEYSDKGVRTGTLQMDGTFVPSSDYAAPEIEIEIETELKIAEQVQVQAQDQAQAQAQQLGSTITDATKEVIRNQVYISGHDEKGELEGRIYRTSFDVRADMFLIQAFLELESAHRLRDVKIAPYACGSLVIMSPDVGILTLLREWYRERKVAVANKTTLRKCWNSNAAEARRSTK